MEPRFRTQQVFSDSYETDIYGGLFYYNGGAAAVMRDFDDEDYQWQYHSGNMSEADYQEVVREYQADYAAANARAMAKKAENQGGSFKKTYNAKNKQYLKEYEESEEEQIAADRQHRKDAMAKIKKDKARVEKAKATRAAKKSAAADDMTVRSELVEIGGGSGKKSRKTTAVTTAAKRKKGGKGSSKNAKNAPAYYHRVNRPRSEAPEIPFEHAPRGATFTDVGWNKASTELKAAVRAENRARKKKMRSGNAGRNRELSKLPKGNIQERLDAASAVVDRLAKKEHVNTGLNYSVPKNYKTKGRTLRTERVM